MANFRNVSGFDDPEEITVLDAYYKDGDFGKALVWETVDEGGENGPTIFYSIGKSMEISSDMKRAWRISKTGERLPDEKQGFDPKSWAGSMVDSLVEHGVAQELVKAGRSDELDANTYVGCRFTVKSLTRDMGQYGVKSRIVPTALLEIVDSPQRATPRAPQRQAESELTGSVNDKLGQVALETSNVEEFRRRVGLDVAEALTDPDLLNRIFGQDGEAYYESLRETAVAF